MEYVQFLPCSNFGSWNLLSYFKEYSLCKIWFSHAGGSEELSHYLINAVFLLGLLYNTENGGDFFIQNIGWNSTE
jgi:hypothetical protein